MPAWRSQRSGALAGSSAQTGVPCRRAGPARRPHSRPGRARGGHQVWRWSRADREDGADG
jgi:hypothetical protein